jgi:hypothetical protein
MAPAEYIQGLQEKGWTRGKQIRELSFLLFYNRASSDARQHQPKRHPEAFCLQVKFPLFDIVETP